MTGALIRTACGRLRAAAGPLRVRRVRLLLPLPTWRHAQSSIRPQPSLAWAPVPHRSRPELLPRIDAYIAIPSSQAAAEAQLPMEARDGPDDQASKRHLPALRSDTCGRCGPVAHPASAPLAAEARTRLRSPADRS